MPASRNRRHVPAAREPLRKLPQIALGLVLAVGSFAATAGSPHAASAPDLVPRVIVFDLANSRPPAGGPESWPFDGENIIGRNEAYVAYLDILPAEHPEAQVSRRYGARGLAVTAIFTLEEFWGAADRFFPGAGRVAAAAEPRAATTGTHFHSYEEVETELRDLATRFPEVAQLISLGPTYEGRELWALKVSRNVAVGDPQKPDVLFTGCHHAREWISVEPPLYFAHRLVEDAATDAGVDALLERAEIWLVPIVNPDGLAYSQQSVNAATDAVRLWRKNRRPITVSGCGSGIGVDLNRNYPYQWRLPGDGPCSQYNDDVGASDDPQEFQVYRGPAAGSELEVQHLVAFTAPRPGRNFVARVDFHNYGQLVLFPWGYTTEPSPARSTQAPLARFLAQSLTGTNWVPYVPAIPPYGVLYPITGGSTDYAFAVDGTVAAFTAELRPRFPPPLTVCGPPHCFFVPEGEIDNVNREAWVAARALIEWSIDPASSPASGRPFAYVANEGSNTLSIINATTGAVASTVTVGATPHGVAAAPTGDLVYVANSGADTVSVVDTARALSDPVGAVIATIPVGAHPSEIALTPDGAFAYVTHAAAGDLAVVDTVTHTVASVALGGQPAGVAITPDGAFAYVARFDAGDVAVMETATRHVATSISVGGNPLRVAVSPNGAFVYVTNAAAGTVSIIDTASNTLVTAIGVGEHPGGVAVMPNGAFLYVTNRDDNSVSVIDTTKALTDTGHAVIATVRVGAGPLDVAISADGALAYVVNAGSNDASVINTDTNSVLPATIAVGASPSAVAFAAVLNQPATPATSPTPTVTPLMTATPSPPICPGDCNGDGKVSTTDALTMLNVLLGRGAALACPGAMGDTGDRLTIADLVRALGTATSQCRGEPR